MKHAWRDAFLAMSPDARRRYAAAHPLQGRTPRFPRIHPREVIPASRDELIQLGRRHRCFTKERLAHALSTSEWAGRLTAEQVAYLFDGWENYVAEVGADPATWGDPARLDDAALAQFCGENGLFTRDAYRARLDRPGAAVLPSTREIEARFGSWGLFGLLCRTYSLDGEMDRYYRECRKADRRLTLAEARRRGIDLQGMIAALGKPLFEELLHLREAADRAAQAPKEKSEDQE